MTAANLFRALARTPSHLLCLRVILAESPLKTELPGILKGLYFGASRGKACFDIRQLAVYSLQVQLVP
jgi:hypothetical protein